jgi:hypothetical protein
VIPLRRKLTAIAEQTEHDRLTALVDAHATEHEKATLDFSAMAGANVRLGWRLTDLAAAAAGEEVKRPFEWDPAALAEVTARIELRRELRLPSRECVVRKPPSEAAHCLCLSQALDALIASAEPTTRDEVLKAAKKAHAERWAWLKRKPRQVSPAPPTRVLEVEPQPKLVPATVVSETNTKPARVVKHIPRWYDEPERRRSIMDMEF